MPGLTIYRGSKAVLHALRNPIAAARYLKVSIAEMAIPKATRISELLGVPENQVEAHFRELGDLGLSTSLGRRVEERKALPLGGMTTSGRGPVLYVLCRLLKPKIVVETGVASGVSSYYILAGLHLNGSGELYSIDVPPVDMSLPVGWAVPDYLTERWHLVLSRSSERLPALLDDLPSVDIFLHDSDHSYENMMYEFRTVWPYISKGGLLLSDDVQSNASFFDFARIQGRTPVRFYLLAALRK